MKCVDKYCIEGVVRRKEHWEVRTGYVKVTERPLYVVVFSLKHLEKTPVVKRKVQNSMEIAEGLPSSAIVKTLSCIRTDNNIYHIYEKVGSGSVRDLALREERLAEGEATHLLREMTRCVSALHAQSVAHRNLRTSSFLVKDGEVRVTGLLNAVKLDRPECQDEVVDMRPVYQPPEARDQPADKKADMYALGASFFEMLFGVPPWRHPPQPFPLCPHSVSEKAKLLLHGLLADAPSIRFDCTEVLQVIETSGPVAGLRNPRPSRASDALHTSLAAFTARMDFLAHFGDELSENWCHLETGIYLLFVVLKRIVQVTSAYKAHLDFQRISDRFPLQREAEFQRVKEFVQQSEREAMSSLISVQNCLQKHVKAGVAPALSKDLEDLAELESTVLMELIVEPFLQQLKGMPTAQKVVKEARRFCRLYEDNLWVNFDSFSTELLE